MPRRKKTKRTLLLKGYRVEDAEKDLVLKITTTDVLGATKGSPSDCAVALAVRRLSHADEVLIHQERAYVRSGDVWTRYVVPNNITREIRAFDMGAEFVPAEYVLRIPSTSQKLGRVRAGKGGEKPSKRRMAKPVRFSRHVRPDMPSGTLLYKTLGADTE